MLKDSVMGKDGSSPTSSRSLAMPPLKRLEVWQEAQPPPKSFPKFCVEAEREPACKSLENGARHSSRPRNDLPLSGVGVSAHAEELQQTFKALLRLVRHQAALPTCHQTCVGVDVGMASLFLFVSQQLDGRRETSRGASLSKARVRQEAFESRSANPELKDGERALSMRNSPCCSLHPMQLDLCSESGSD